MTTLDDVYRAAGRQDGALPMPGETWIRADGALAVVEAITSCGIGPMKVCEANGRRTHRTRDGRFAIMGRRGACPEDLMQRCEE